MIKRVPLLLSALIIVLTSLNFSIPALAQQPQLVLLDEPTLHLDIGAQVELLERLRQLAEENKYAVVVVTHELALAAEFAREVLSPNGFFLAKVLQGGTEGDLLASLKRDFAKVHHVKPAASRADSAELYVLATGFRERGAA